MDNALLHYCPKWLFKREGPLQAGLLTRVNFLSG
jgi:hypothetical protein